MTTVNWSTVVDHSTDAGFRAWGSEFNAKLALSTTMVNTADTGQINWGSVTRAGTNANAGFEIWKLNDSLFGTAPVYFRIDYGTGSTTATPRMQITMGTATNGSGTLSGTASFAATTITNSGAPASTVTNYQSYICAKEGFFGFVWKVGAVAAGSAYTACFFFARSCDASGTPTVTGGSAGAWQGTGSTLVFHQSFRFASVAAAYTSVTTAANMPCVAPGQPTSSLDDSGNSQVYVWWMQSPTVRPNFAVGTALQSDVGLAVTLSVALVGASARTLLGTPVVSNCETGAVSSRYRVCMLWE